jgi:hypothetical protein
VFEGVGVAEGRARVALGGWFGIVHGSMVANFWVWRNGLRTVIGGEKGRER